jgi:hypothetical protein
MQNCVTQRFWLALVCAAWAAAPSSAQPGASAPPALQAVWSVSADLQSPESVYFDRASNSLFVSNINGAILAKDGNGYISRLTPEGKVVNMKWAIGLNGPKGLRSHAGTLWAADIDEVVGIDIASGRITQRIAVQGSAFLNDLATAPDGTIYVSDSQTYRIYVIKNGTPSIFAEGNDVEVPNGLLVDGNRLILGTIGPIPTGDRAAAPGRGGAAAPGSGPADTGHLYAFDLKTRVRTRIANQPVGGIDGVELDGAGGLIVSDVVGGHILQVSKAGSVRVLRQMPGPADIAYLPSSKTVIVPHLRDNKVAAYSLADVVR